jgi:response regulator of citrate/malate metabolism
MIYTCAIVENEPLAEKMLRKYISRFSFLELAWTCAYAKEAIRLMEVQKVDLLFLDLQEVPIRADGSFAYLIKQHDQIIVSSPYPAEALGDQLPLTAFLLKPIAFDHFLEAIECFLTNVD